MTLRRLILIASGKNKPNIVEQSTLIELELLCDSNKNKIRVFEEEPGKFGGCNITREDNFSINAKLYGIDYRMK